MLEPRDVARWQNVLVPTLIDALDDPDALAQAAPLLDMLMSGYAWKVREMVETGGYSWGEIAKVLGRDRGNLFRSYSRAEQPEWMATAAARREEKMATLNAQAPDLAEQVRHAGLALAEALRELRDRERCAS